MTDQTKYTAEDFAKAEFARHPDGRVAARMDPGDPNQPWFADSRGRGWCSDQHMADGHWTPVREADGDRLAELTHTITTAIRSAVEGMTEEQVRNLVTDAYNLEQIREVVTDAYPPDPAPITLEALEAAWEQAEPTDAQHEATAGDLVIHRASQRSFSIWEAFGSTSGPALRILQRAGRPEGAEELEALLMQADIDGGQAYRDGYPALANYLAERGVRVVADK